MKLLDERPHVLGKWRFESVRRAGGIGEAEEGRMEGEAGEDGSFVLFLFAQLVIPFDR